MYVDDWTLMFQDDAKSRFGASRSIAKSRYLVRTSLDLPNMHVRDNNKPTFYLMLPINDVARGLDS